MCKWWQFNGTGEARSTESWSDPVLVERKPYIVLVIALHNIARRSIMNHDSSCLALSCVLQMISIFRPHPPIVMIVVGRVE